MKRVFWILITPLLTFLVAWNIGNWFILPKIEEWSRSELQSYSKTHLPFEIQVDKVKLRILRPSLIIEGIKLLPNKISPEGFAKILPKVHFASLKLQLDVFHLLGGRLNFSTLVADSADVHLNIDPILEDTSPAKELPVDDIFSISEKVPLPKILFQNTHFTLESPKNKLKIEIHHGGLLLTNMGKNITAKTSFPNMQVHSTPYGIFAAEVNTHVYLTKQSLRLLELSIKMDDLKYPGTELSAHGEINPLKLLTTKPSGIVAVTAKASVNDFIAEIKKNQPQLKIPTITGTIQTDAEARFKGTDNFQGRADIKTFGMLVDKWELGDAKIQGEFNNHTLSFSEIGLKHPAGMAILTASQVQLGHEFDFKSKINLKTLDLQKLFSSLELNNIPVGTTLSGELPCVGKLHPSQFKLSCDQVQLKAADLWVKSENTPQGSEILNLKSLTAFGKLNVTNQSVIYDASLRISNALDEKIKSKDVATVGTSDGMIDYEKGFKINFKTNNLRFEDIQNLAHLRMQGAVGIEGHTEGNSQTATFAMNLNAKDFIFENFNLGTMLTQLSLKKGHLIFDEITGLQNKTQYFGKLDLNLNKDTLTGDFKSSVTELADVSTILAPFYHFPMAVQGVGAIKAHIDGPLDFWKLNYTLESTFHKVSIGPESFDSLILNIAAQNGNLKTQKVELHKNASLIQLNGGIHSDQIMNLSLSAKNLKIEEVDSINKFTSSIYGNISFNSEITGTTTNPQVVVSGNITNTILGDQEMAPSSFDLKTDKWALNGHMKMFGDKISGEIQLPYNKNLPDKNSLPLIIKANADKWNFSSLLALVGGANLAADYDSSISASVDIRSESGDLLKSTGKGHINEFYLKRDEMSLRNPAPIEVSSHNGIIQIKNFVLNGPKNSIHISGNNFTADKLNITIDAKTDLRLLQMFAPFLEDIGGPLEVSASIGGPFTKPELIGTASISDTFVKLKGFPHVIEKLFTDISFSQSKIILTDITGQMTGGTLSGEGLLVIKGVRNLQTSIQAHLENITMNIPDKVRTVGDADLVFSGNWFPFVLSGSYRIRQGVFEKEFIEGGNGVAGIKQSLYLPKILRDGQFDPVTLDLQINLEKPMVVKNSMFDGAVKGDLQVKGPIHNPILIGKISAEKKSKLIFKDKSFEVQNATVDFNSLTEINPNIFATATSRIHDYDITLIAQGPSKNINITTSSVPPLSDQDIISLIALGVTSNSSNRTPLQLKAVAEQTGLEIGGAVLAKPLNKQLESTLGFNLAVTSQYDSTRNISIPKITLSRKLSEKLKVSGSRPVGDLEGYDVKLEYQLNNNMTAVGSYENKSLFDSTSLQNTPQETQNIFGIDLEFKREFK